MILLSKNLELKILALLSAIVLWFFVVGIENTVYLFPQDLEIQAQNIPKNLTFTSDFAKAKLRLRANQDVIKNLTKSDFEIFVDLRDLEAGDYNLPLSARINNDKVTLIKIEPPNIHVKLEPVIEKEVKIKAFTSGNAQKGYSVKEIRTDMQTAKISGPKSLVDKITMLNAAFELDGTQTTSFKQNVKLTPDKALGTESQNLTITPDQVSVDVTVAADLQQKNVIVKPNIQGSVDLFTIYQKVEVAPFTVVIQGQEDVLNSISYLLTEPLQLEKLKEQHGAPLRAKLVLPKNVSLLNPGEGSVLVSLKILSPSPSP